MASQLSSASGQQEVESEGFDCEFVDPPPEHLIQSECPVCLQILREPDQVTCCGKRFCHSCIKTIKASKNPCPTCKAKKLSAFPDKALKQSLYAFKVRCSHKKDGCEWIGELGQLDEHLNSNNQHGCQLVVINCPLATCEPKCAVKLPRKDMPDHLIENLLSHFSLLATSHAKQQAEIASLSEENRAVKKECEHLKGLLSDPSRPNQRMPAPRNTKKTILTSEVITMPDFEQHKIDGDAWYSSPVYTHHEGYKICLRVEANGQGASAEGTHVSVYVHFMRGEYDRSLPWPFRGVIKFRMLDQYGGDHRSSSSTYTDQGSDTVCCRVVYAERSTKGRGTEKFIAHASLGGKYLKDDCIKLQICGGEVHV